MLRLIRMSTATWEGAKQMTGSGKHVSTAEASGPPPVLALMRLFDETVQDAKAAPERLELILQDASAALSALRRQILAEGRRQPAELLPWQIRKLTGLIEEKLHGALPVQAMAEAVRLSRSHFSRAFAASFRCAPHAYVQRRRLERAKHLMRTTEEPLAEIAVLCGLADQSHLCRLFRRQLGETPSAWRRRQAAPTPRPAPLATAA